MRDSYIAVEADAALLILSEFEAVEQGIEAVGVGGAAGEGVECVHPAQHRDERCYPDETGVVRVSGGWLHGEIEFHFLIRFRVFTSFAWIHEQNQRLGFLICQLS